MWLVALTGQHRVVSRQTRVSRIDPILLPLPSPPQHRDVNLEVVRVEDSVSSVGGVLADKKGNVLAIWASFHRDEGGTAKSRFRGLPVEVFEQLPAPYPGSTATETRILGAELRLVAMADARELGLSQEWAEVLEAHDPERKQVLSISRLYGGTHAAQVLQGGDLLLAIDGVPATRFLELERASQAPRLTLSVFREGEVQSIEVETRPVARQGVERAAIWGGAFLHDPHPEVAAQRGDVTGGVYVAWYWYGSPASRYGLRATRRIVEVDGRPTPDLGAFLDAVAEVGNGEAVRIMTEDLDGVVRVLTLKADLDYWPTRELRLVDGVWVVVE